jgi:hypothetical protein
LKYILTALLFAGLAWSTQAYAQSRIELVPYAAELGTAVDITHAGDGRLFVARQYGAIFLVRDSMDVADIEFLDIASRVLFNGERGLLGMAFDPDFATNGHFYVNYITGTGDGISRISRFTVGPNPDVADPNSEVVLISLPQPNPIHQAGGLAFGTDGYLYCALGDGGGSDDPNNEGQDPTSLFGTILRIKPESDGTYSIPPDNPFVGASGDTLPEIWAYGLRNPFRFGIDPANGDLWIGDVGQERWEELDHWPGGLNTGPNFGWRCYEGNAPFITAGCADSTTFQWPVVALSHGILGGTACAIVAARSTGAHVIPTSTAGTSTPTSAPANCARCCPMGKVVGWMNCSCPRECSASRPSVPTVPVSCTPPTSSPAWCIRSWTAVRRSRSPSIWSATRWSPRRPIPTSGS